MNSAALSGLRVLLVEDEMLVSLLIEEMLIDHHCVIVGPFEQVAGALESARSDTIHLAILDVNVAGLKVYPVAEILSARGIPFLLLSGYGKSAVPSEHPDWRVCSKPFRSQELVSMMIEQVQRA